jgi:hypothetical protein
VTDHLCEGTIVQSPPGQGRVTTLSVGGRAQDAEWGPGMTEQREERS